MTLNLKRCRLCAEFKNDLIHFKDEVVINSNLFTKITECLHFDITEAPDSLPQTVCIECCDKVRTFYDFVILVQHAQNILRESAETILKHEDEKEEIKVEGDQSKVVLEEEDDPEAAFEDEDEPPADNGFEPGNNLSLYRNG